MPTRSPDERRDARASANEAIGRVDKNAVERWKALAYRAGRYLAERHEEIDSQMIHDALARYYPDVKTHEYRAFGPIMRRLARDRVLERTDRTRKSGQRKNHDRDLRIWKSLLYEKHHDG